MWSRQVPGERARAGDAQQMRVTLRRVKRSDWFDEEIAEADPTRSRYA